MRTSISSMTRARMLGATLAAFAVMVALFATAASANAAPGEPRHARPETVAIAIGTVGEHDGGHTWLSLQAGIVEGVARGGFRYYCEEAGYYNGAVRVLSVTDGAVHAEGAGGLRRPDGTRMRVTFTLDIAADGATTIAIVGAEYEYAMAGGLEGFVFAGDPAAGLFAP